MRSPMCFWRVRVANLLISFLCFVYNVFSPFFLLRFVVVIWLSTISSNIPLVCSASHLNIHYIVLCVSDFYKFLNIWKKITTTIEKSFKKIDTCIHDTRNNLIFNEMSLLKKNIMQLFIKIKPKHVQREHL